MRLSAHGCRLPLFAALLLSAGLCSHAATLTVNNRTDGAPGSLRHAVASAANGDTIAFAPAITGTLTLTQGEIAITKTLTIAGPGMDVLTLTPNTGSRHFSIGASAGQLTISGLTLYRGAVYLYDGYAQALGGSIYNPGGRLELRQCRLSNNGVTNTTGSAFGGAIYNLGTLVVTDCQFAQNYVQNGTNEAVDPFSATLCGGAVYHGGGTATITGTTFANNFVSGGGSNVASYGGAIYQQGASTSLTLINCNLSENEAYAYASNDDYVFGRAEGGGVYNRQGSLIIRDSTFSGNTAQAYTEADNPGGAYAYGAGLSHGSNTNSGSTVATAQLTNCTFYQNKTVAIPMGPNSASGRGGGGIYNSLGGHIVAFSCTVANNSGAEGGGIINAAGNVSTVDLGNTIVAGNTGNSGVRDVSGAFGSYGFNLVGVLGYATGFTGTNEQLGRESSPLNAKLGDPVFGGGLGPTLAPRYGSPALDRGRNFGLNLDQRGYSRTRDLLNASNVSGSDTTDIGAVEVQSLFVKGDFNRDGTSDIVWQNTQTGQRNVWTIRNAAVYQVTTVENVGPEWQIAAVGDMTGDGLEDLVWQNTQTGQRDIWLMSGVARKLVIHLPTVDVAWEIAGVGDFDADGQNDIVWQNTHTGERDIWLMNGTNLRQVVHLPLVGTEWRIGAVGDMDGDGFSDLVWQNTQTGQRGVWLLRNAGLASTYFLPDVDLAWQIVGTGDFNNDGRTDLVWQNTQTGDRDIWLLANGTYQAVRLATIDLAWSIANH